MEKYGKYNHILLNIASDCVINEYLINEKKLPPISNGLITAKSLKDAYNVDYKPREDTQFTLYEKLLAA